MTTSPRELQAPGEIQYTSFSPAFLSKDSVIFIMIKYNLI